MKRSRKRQIRPERKTSDQPVDKKSDSAPPKPAANPADDWSKRLEKGRKQLKASLPWAAEKTLRQCFEEAVLEIGRDLRAGVGGRVLGGPVPTNEFASPLLAWRTAPEGYAKQPILKLGRETGCPIQFWLEGWLRSSLGSSWPNHLERKCNSHLRNSRGESPKACLNLLEKWN